MVGGFEEDVVEVEVGVDDDLGVGLDLVEGLLVEGEGVS